METLRRFIQLKVGMILQLLFIATFEIEGSLRS